MQGVPATGRIDENNIFLKKKANDFLHIEQEYFGLAILYTLV